MVVPRTGEEIPGFDTMTGEQRALAFILDRVDVLLTQQAQIAEGLTTLLTVTSATAKTVAALIEAITEEEA